MNQDIEQQARKGADEKYPRPHISQFRGPNQLIDYAEAVLARMNKCRGYYDALISERSKPSIMVGFSEEDVRLIADGVAEDCGVDDETEDGAYTWKCMLECAMKVHEAHAANTRAVSIDKIMEVVKEATWINDVDLLRERLMKMAP